MTIRSTTTDYTAYHSSLGILPSDSSNSQSCSYDDNDDDVDNVGIKSHDAQHFFPAGTRRRSNMILLVGLCMVFAAGGTVMHQGQLTKTFLVEQLAALCTTSKSALSSSKRVGVGGGDNVVYNKAGSIAQAEEEEDSVDDGDNNDDDAGSIAQQEEDSVDDNKDAESIAQEREDSVDDGDN